MSKSCRAGLLALAGLGLTFVAGCQNSPMDAGITLPSPWYLQHPPQYFPPSPPYPLSNELNGLEDAQKKVNENQQP